MALALLLAPGCRRAEPTGEAPRKGPIEYPVEVQRLAAQRVEYAVTAVGSVEAFESVQVTARVAGVLDRVPFREGQDVKQGALLAEIEPQRFELAVAQAQAALDRASAALGEAERELERSQKLQAEGIATSVDVSGWQTKQSSARAAESEARAAVALARLNLRDARVRAPIAGTIQTRSVQTGQYVQAGAVLATLIDKEPLLLRFKVAENEAARLTLGASAEFRIKDDPSVYRAKIDFIAGAAEPASRMVPVVCEVEAEKQIRPGTFAEVRVPIGAAENAVVAPETAIRPSERGFLGYVVDGNVARERILTLGLRTPEGKVEVQRGLSPGELLVIRGSEALRDGVKVKVAKGAP